MWEEVRKIGDEELRREAGLWVGGNSERESGRLNNCGTRERGWCEFTYP